MTVAYPLTTQIDHTELLYSLRSVEKFLPQPYEVVIVGDELPDWITNVTQIALPDIRGKKQLSIRSKILAALEYAEEILFLNDDIFFLKEWTDFPYYWHGMLKTYSESGSKSLEKQLLAMNKPVKHFDGHMPLIYKQDFKEVSEHFTEDCIIKSMYCNYLSIEGVFAPDCKLLRAAKPHDVNTFIKDKPCFSSGVYSLPSALPVLQQLYPNKSNFEV